MLTTSGSGRESHIYAYLIFELIPISKMTACYALQLSCATNFYHVYSLDVKKSKTKFLVLWM